MSNDEGQLLAVPAGNEEDRTRYVKVPKGFFIAGLVAVTALVGAAFGLAVSSHGLAVSNRAAIEGQTAISSNQEVSLNPADQVKSGALSEVGDAVSKLTLGDIQNEITELMQSEASSQSSIQEEIDQIVANGNGLSSQEKAEIETMLGASKWYLYFKGDKGQKGMKGQKGYKGQKGQKGQKGYKGQKGQKGQKGYKGQKGQKGQKGYKGQKGQKGQKGYKGQKGQKGQKGYKGQKGQKGQKGYKGQKGQKGEFGWGTDGWGSPFPFESKGEAGIEDVPAGIPSAPDGGV